MDLKLGRNAAWALAEVAVSSCTLFVLYCIVTADLGVKALGIWSLVLATTSLARFGDMGASAGLGRLVAIADAKAGKSASDYVETAIITTFALYATMALLLYWPVRYALSRTLHGADFDAAQALLPFALVSFTLTMVSGGVTTGLIGQHRADQKSKLGIAAFALQLAMAVAFVKSYGLVALAWAQIAQNVLIFCVGWAVFLRNDLGHWSSRIPHRWRPAVLGELLGFGMRLQAANLISFLFEPLTKFVMSSVGGLEALGLYEMANRMILQGRQLVVGPTQVLTPAFAAQQHTRDGLAHLYDRALGIALPIAAVMIFGLIIASPGISAIWLGHVDRRFVLFVAIMGCGWLVNIVASPAYLLGVGRGYVGWNIVGHVVTSLGGPMLSLALGSLMGGVGVALGASTMLIAGAVISMVWNCRQAGVKPFSSPTVFWAVQMGHVRSVRRLTRFAAP